MAKEVLAIPEEHLAEVIRVIRHGLKRGMGAPRISKEVRKALTSWCHDEEEYVKSNDFIRR